MTNKVNDYGDVIVSVDEYTELIYAGKSDIQVFHEKGDPDFERYNKFLSEFDNAGAMVDSEPEYDISAEDYHASLQSSIMIPDEYSEFDIETHIKELVEPYSQEYKDRVHLELSLFKEMEMLHILKVLRYHVDTFNKENVLWGVGRGSSVASLCLYLLDVHMIDPIKYRLDINEFLKRT